MPEQSSFEGGEGETVLVKIKTHEFMSLLNSNGLCVAHDRDIVSVMSGWRREVIPKHWA